MPIPRLTERQYEAYRIICEYIEEHQMPPTIRVIADEMGISSPNGVLCHLRALEKKGYLRKHKGKWIPVKPVPPEERGYPFLGITTAGAIGEPLELNERLDFAAEYGETFFFIKVTGDSMTEAGILDGDHLLVATNIIARYGDIVVARTDDGTTVKRYFPQLDGTIKLAPDNRFMQPVVVDSVEVLGVVQKSLRDVG